MKKISMILFASVWAVAVFAQGKIQFLEPKHDFESVAEEGGKVSHVFGFKNVGDAPITIKNVKTTCGCTSPKWTKATIPPGKGGYVEATFDPMHRPGAFSKVLTVIMEEGEPVNSYLTIYGEVLPRKKTVEDLFPMQRGNLRYQMPQVFMGKVRIGEIDTIHMRIYNASMEVITLDKVGVPKHISADIVKKEIGPKSFGKIILSYDAMERAELGMVTDQIILLSDDPKEPEQIIYVVAEIEQYIKPMTPAELAEAPKLTVKEEMVDLGEVKAGDILTGIFKIGNDGNRTLRIIKVKPECGCTTTSFSISGVESGKEVPLSLQFDTTGYDGLVIKKIDVYSNDPLNPKTTLKIQAFVVPQSK